MVGLDNVPQAAWPSFDLTTVQQNVEQMVDATRTLLFELSVELMGGRPGSLGAGCAAMRASAVLAWVAAFKLAVVANHPQKMVVRGRGNVNLEESTTYCF